MGVRVTAGLWLVTAGFLGEGNGEVVMVGVDGTGKGCVWLVTAWRVLGRDVGNRTGFWFRRWCSSDRVEL